MVTNEAIDAKDQHACTTFSGGNRLAVQARTWYQAQNLRQLRALHCNTIASLSGNNFQCAIATGDQQRRNGDDGTRLGR